MTTVVYVVGGPAVNDRDDLRHSLRSLRNLPDLEAVWIVGTVPRWVTGVRALPLAPKPEKLANQRASLTAVVAKRDLPARFALLNDDHYIVEPVDALPPIHLGPWSGFHAGQLADGQNQRNTWWRGLCETAAWMADHGHPDPLVYECHTPLIFDKAKLAKVLATYPPDGRFCVGMTYDLTGAGGVGTWGPNVKVKTEPEFRAKVKLVSPAVPYLSSTDVVFADGSIGRHVRGLFPDPSPYETVGRTAPRRRGAA